MNEMLNQVERLEKLMANRPYASFDKTVRFVLAGEPEGIGENGEPLVYRRFSISNPWGGGKMLFENGELGRYSLDNKYINAGDLENVILPVDICEILIRDGKVKGITKTMMLEQAIEDMDRRSRFEELLVGAMHAVGWPYTSESAYLRDNVRYQEPDFTERFEELSPLAVGLLMGNLTKLEQGMKRSNKPVVTMNMVLQIK